MSLQTSSSAGTYYRWIHICFLYYWLPLNTCSDNALTITYLQQSKLQCIQHSHTNAAWALDTHHNGFTDSEANHKDSGFVVDMAHKLLGNLYPPSGFWELKHCCSLEHCFGQVKTLDSGAEIVWRLLTACWNPMDSHLLENIPAYTISQEYDWVLKNEYACWVWLAVFSQWDVKPWWFMVNHKLETSLYWQV